MPVPMDSTLSGSVTEVRPVQFAKAIFPMDETLSGILIEVKLTQS